MPPDDPKAVDMPAVSALDEFVSGDDVAESQESLSVEELRVLDERAKAVTGEPLPRGSQYPHAGNIAKKLRDHQGKGTALSAAIDSILKEYIRWRKTTLSSEGTEEEVISAKVAAFEAYSAFLDTEPVDEFDSRGALVSSALEEFCFYLLKPILDAYPTALLGKQDTYQGLYFTAARFDELLRLPTVHTPVNTLDFIIGALVEGSVKTQHARTEFPIRLPAVAVECKGYLDRPRFIESQNMARAIKSAFPQCCYILVAQCLKLDLKKIGVAPDIDAIYVWRRMQNVDRKMRRAEKIDLKPFHVPAVQHFYSRVKAHLTQDWALADPFGSGILK